MMLSTYWMLQANCAKIDPEIFFERENASVAKRICRGCDVLNDCLAYALCSEVDLHGIWGGTTSFERHRIKNFDLYFPNQKDRRS